MEIPFTLVLLLYEYYSIKIVLFLANSFDIYIYNFAQGDCKEEIAAEEDDKAEKDEEAEEDNEAEEDVC